MENSRIKVFLVEDEIVIREGIKRNINWGQEGFDFAGEASDGELAYPLIQSTKPDILITDIKMPFMDGLELSRLVKKELPDIKILVLSGYNEFEYAKEAINIGITEYLVKPISGAKLLEAVKKVAKTILEERQQRQFLLAYQKEQKESEQPGRVYSEGLCRENTRFPHFLGRAGKLAWSWRLPGIILFCSRFLPGWMRKIIPMS